MTEQAKQVTAEQGLKVEWHSQGCSFKDADGETARIEIYNGVDLWFNCDGPYINRPQAAHLARILAHWSATGRLEEPPEGTAEALAWVKGPRLQSGDILVREDEAIAKLAALTARAEAAESALAAAQADNAKLSTENDRKDALINSHRVDLARLRASPVGTKRRELIAKVESLTEQLTATKTLLRAAEKSDPLRAPYDAICDTLRAYDPKMGVLPVMDVKALCERLKASRGKIAPHKVSDEEFERFIQSCYRDEPQPDRIDTLEAEVKGLKERVTAVEKPDDAAACDWPWQRLARHDGWHRFEDGSRVDMHGGAWYATGRNGRPVGASGYAQLQDAADALEAIGQGPASAGQEAK